MGLDDLRLFFLQKKAERDGLQARLNIACTSLEEERKKEARFRSAEELVMKTTLVAQQQIKERFETLATTALKWVYSDQDLALKVELGKRGTSPTLTFLVDSNGVELDPLSSTGGGVVQVLALVLRLTVLESLHVKGPLLLDEPLSQLSREYQSRAGEFLKEYARRTNRQILLVSHSPEIVSSADKVFRISLREGRSVVTERLEGEDGN